jgi:hypothetical protein
MGTAAAERGTSGRIALPGGALRRILTSPPLVPLFGGAGLAAAALAFSLSRGGDDGAGPNLLLWAGTLLILVPAALHLLAARTGYNDRLLLVAFVALAAYGLKVMHDPSAFHFGDEYVHLSATQRLQAQHDLFALVPVAGSTVAGEYPGLHALTVALSDVTTLPLFTSGVIVIGLARLILALGLFLLFGSIATSARLAGIGALLYAASPNYLFFTAQYSYESLSLPLFVAVMAVAATLPGTPRGARGQSIASVVLLTAAIAITHHLTSYALVATFLGLSVMALRPVWRATRAVGFTIVAAGASLAWLLTAATGTGSYLGFVLDRTVSAITDVQQSGTRKPFESSGSLQTPLPERVLALAAAAAVCLGVVLALRDLYRRRVPLSAPAALLVAASAAFLVLFPLKVLPGAWETANRSSDFLYIGVAFVLAGLLMRRVTVSRRPRWALAGASVFIAAIICGGIIQGWPSKLRLSHPTQAKAGGAIISAPGLAAAQWATRHLPRDAVYLADEASGRELAVAGAAKVYPGRAIQAPQLFEDPTLPWWQGDLLRRKHIDFVVLDRRKVTADNTAGYYLQQASDPDLDLGYYSPGVRRKYDRIARSRTVYDTGDVAIIDVRGLSGALPACAAVTDRTWSEAFACVTPTAARYYGSQVDDTVRTRSMRATALATRTERRVDGLHVTVLMQLLDTTRQGFAPDATQRGFTLRVGDVVLHRRTRRIGRSDDLHRATTLVPGRQLERSVTFVLGAREAERFRRDGAVLGIDVPHTSGRAQVGYLRLAASTEERG